MEKMSLKNELSGNSYPGRGIIIGKSADGKHASHCLFYHGHEVRTAETVFLLRMERESARRRLILPN